MKKILLFAAVAAFVGFSSCTKTQVDPPQNDQTISFGTFLGKGKTETKATVTNIGTLEGAGVGFYVLAYPCPADWATNGASAKPDVMYKEHVTYSTPNWVYTNTKYWPSSGNVSFFAYAPAEGTGTGLTLSPASTTGAPTLTVQIKNSIADQFDLVVAGALDRTFAQGKVPLTFRHALTSFGFKAKMDAALPSNVKIKITGINIKASSSTDVLMNKKVITLGNTESTNTSTWANHTTPTYFQTSNNFGNVEHPTAANLLFKTSDATTAKEISDPAKVLMLCPWTSSSTAGDLVITLSYTEWTDTDNDDTINGSEVSAARTFVYNLPASTAFDMGKRYVITFNIKLRAIVFGTMTVEGWDDVTTIPDVDIPA